jgi:hypothetical protein
VIQSSRRVEDIRVEVKAMPPEGNAAARRLAAHANAVRGAHILWLLGIEEMTGKFFEITEEPSSWYRRVRSQFEGDCPQLEVDRHIDCPGGRVWALCFGTKTWPYVVKNEKFNTPGGGPVQFEVPIRIGTEVQSARRIDLVRLLDRVAHAPQLEVIGVHVEARPSGEQWLLSVRMLVLCMPAGAEAICIPFHKCRGKVSFEGWSRELIQLKISPRLEAQVDGRGAARDRSIDPNVVYSGADVRMVGAAPLLLSGIGIATRDDLPKLRASGPLEVEFELGVVHGSGSVGVSGGGAPAASNAQAGALRWESGEVDAMWARP